MCTMSHLLPVEVSPRATASARASGLSAARPRIGIDARDLLIAERTGVERVVYHFIEQLSATAACELTLYLDAEPPPALALARHHEVMADGICEFVVLTTAADPDKRGAWG